jgi:hypothetical protein
MRFEGPLENATLPLGVSTKSFLDLSAAALDPGEAFLAATLVILQHKCHQHSCNESNSVGV